MATNSTEVSLECCKSQTRFVRPRHSNTGQHDGFKQSPQTFSRGNLSRSRTSVRKPARAQNAAQLDPAGPPPTIATSNISIVCLISFVMSREVETSLILQSPSRDSSTSLGMTGGGLATAN